MNKVLFQVDAFTDRVFGGNPAAVVPLESWPDDALLQNIATENNLAETAFFVPVGQDQFELRWFTPVKEVRLCGHATLATGHVLYHHLGFSGDRIRFRSREAGELTVERLDDGYRLNFPADQPQPCDVPEPLQLALGFTPNEVLAGTDDLLVILEHEDQVLRVDPDMGKLRLLDNRGVIVSAPGNEVDFVSRCFFPAYGIDEDPVTGSAHTLMTPYWARRLGKNDLRARQLSARVGHLHCHLRDDRVWLDGQARTYLVGEMSW